jgi:Flp pilus assembly protein TadD
MLLGASVKPIVATLPIAWLLFAALLPARGEEGWTAGRRVGSRLLPSAPLLALAVAQAIFELRATSGGLDAGFSVPGLPPAAFLATQCRVIPTYLRLALLPVGQSADWVFPASRGFAEPRVLLGALLLLALAGGAVALGARARRLDGGAAALARLGALGPLLFLLVLAPSSSVVPLHDVLAEHRVYLGLLALAIPVAAALALARRRWLPGRGGGVAAAAGAVALLALLGGATARRAETWSSAVALWTDVVEKGPAKARGHLNLGVALAARGKLREAVEEYHRAAGLLADGTVPEETLLTDLVDALTSLGRVEEARGEVAAALARSPGAPRPQALLAQVEFVGGRLDAAEIAGLRALVADPANGTALKYVGLVRVRRGDWAGAVPMLRGAAEANRTDTMVQWELGRAEEATGNVAGACAAYRRAATEPGLAARAARAAQSWAALGCR